MRRFTPLALACVLGVIITLAAVQSLGPLGLLVGAASGIGLGYLAATAADEWGRS